MDKQLNKMKKSDFLLGDWNLEYRIPRAFSVRWRLEPAKAPLKELWTKNLLHLITNPTYRASKDRRMEFLSGIAKKKYTDSGGSKVPEVSCRQPVIF